MDNAEVQRLCGSFLFLLAVVAPGLGSFPLHRAKSQLKQLGRLVGLVVEAVFLCAAGISLCYADGINDDGRRIPTGRLERPFENVGIAGLRPTTLLSKLSDDQVEFTLPAFEGLLQGAGGYDLKTHFLKCLRFT